VRLRRRLMLALYLLCALAVIEGLGWITWRTVRLERQSRTETVVRLALWRMDSALTPVIAQEAARPYFHYLPFYPFERAYTELWQEVRPGEVVAPSPLLSAESPFIKLHFQIEPDGRLTSPQAPAGNMRDQAEAEYVSPGSIIEAERRLVEMALLLRPQQKTAGRGFENQRGQARPRERAAPADESPPIEGYAGVGVSPLLELPPAAETRPPAPSRAGQRADALDYGARHEQAELARGAVQNFSKSAPAGETLLDAAAGFDRTQVSSDAGRVEQGPLRAQWLADGELALLRTVRLRQWEITQGVWLDWPALVAWLEAQVHDLLPEARLVPVAARGDGDERMLATIPAALLPGAPAATVVATPARLALVITWIAVLAAVIAGGLILRASMRLAERRGRFVSAVTHELRTPLTTFRLYSDMLAEGAIPEESRRREYLRTLQAESQRLGTIVENVLEYARLGSAPPRRSGHDHPPEPLAPVLAAIEPDLRARAARCGLELQVDGEVAGARVAAPAGAIERIIANLVDNACKYAAEAEDRRLILRAGIEDAAVEISLRDFGPGVPPVESGRIFDAWTRARRDADSGTSGLGLGLSISRALARQLGGDLELRQPEGPGAEFVLRLPVA
jgi:signal transduction histidine kinase